MPKRIIRIDFLETLLPIFLIDFFIDQIDIFRDYDYWKFLKNFMAFLGSWISMNQNIFVKCNMITNFGLKDMGIHMLKNFNMKDLLYWKYEILGNENQILIFFIFLIIPYPKVDYLICEYFRDDFLENFRTKNVFISKI